MKITDVKIFTVDCFRTNWVFVKVYTDEGISGVGEATLEYKEKALWGAVEHIKEALVGKDPRNIEDIWHGVYRDAYWRGGAVLMSDNLSSLPKVVETARRTVSIVKANIAFILISKLIVFVLGFRGIAPMWLAVFADVGVSVLTVLNAVRILNVKN